MTGRRADEDLLAACAHEPEAFTELYRRHVAGVLAYLVRRTHHAELATDLAAEVFATALEKSHRYDPSRAPVVAWLYGIAANVLGTSSRRGRLGAGQ